MSSERERERLAFSGLACLLHREVCLSGPEFDFWALILAFGFRFPAL
uniref:Uncharacterized protein n=1 Tax=Arundo donax TaxID=35708 RepID=A0A0A9GGF7_ARUDO